MIERISNWNIGTNVTTVQDGLII